MTPRGHRTSRLVQAALFFSLALAATPAVAQPPAEPPSIDADDREAIIDDVLQALDETYIFAEVATAMAEHLRARLAAGDYDELDRLPDFTAR